MIRRGTPAPLIVESTPGPHDDHWIRERLSMAALRAQVDRDREFIFPDRFLQFDHKGVCPLCGRKPDRTGRVIMGLLGLATFLGALALLEFMALARL